MKSRLKNIVDTIVEAVRPQQIILFGSRAKKNHTQTSDYDLLVVKKGVKNERLVSRRIYHAFFDKKIKEGVDVVVVGTDKLNLNKDNPYRIYSWALKEGKVLYG